MINKLEKYKTKHKKWLGKKENERGDEPQKPEIDRQYKDIIVQIMLTLDKNLKDCFKGQTQNQFF